MEPTSIMGKLPFLPQESPINFIQGTPACFKKAEALCKIAARAVVSYLNEEKFEGLRKFLGANGVAWDRDNVRRLVAGYGISHPNDIKPDRLNALAELTRPGKRPRPEMGRTLTEAIELSALAVFPPERVPFLPTVADPSDQFNIGFDLLNMRISDEGCMGILDVDSSFKKP